MVLSGLGRRLRRRAVAVALAALVAVGGMLAVPVPAHAAFQQATWQCWPGPSGNACARLFYDPVTNVWRAYGAVDPNPGRSIVLETVALVHCSSPNGGCRIVSQRSGSGPGTAYQRITTDGRGPGCYWFADIYYYAGGKGYFRTSPIGGRC